MNNYSSVHMTRYFLAGFLNFIPEYFQCFFILAFWIIRKFNLLARLVNRQ